MELITPLPSTIGGRSVWSDTSVSGTLAGVLDRITGTDQQLLMPTDAMDRVRVISRQLPAALGRWTYLESRLLDPHAVDMVCVLYRDAARALLYQMHDSQGSVLFRRPVWRAATRLIEEWVNRTAWWANAVDHLWLEFDTGSGSSPDPGVFVCLGERRPSNYSLHARRRLLHAVRRALLGRRGDVLREPLDRFLDTLPAGAYVPYLGAMLQRGAPTLRVCVTGLDDAALTAALATSAGPFADGQAALLAELLPAISARRDPGPSNTTSMLHVDIDADGLTPRVGVEHAIDRTPQLRGVLPDARFRSWLVDRGWCQEQMSTGLARWPGLGVAAFAGDACPHRTMRLVNHTKLVLNRDEPPHFKAYLALAHWPVSTHTLRLVSPE